MAGGGDARDTLNNPSARLNFLCVELQSTDLFRPSLAEELSPRASATHQESEAALFLADLFEGWEYEVELQEFDAPSTSIYYVTGFSLLTQGIVVSYEVKYTYLDDQNNTAFFSLPLDPASLTAGQD